MVQRQAAPHQYRIPAASLQEAVQRLQRVDLAAVESFDELHDVINAAIRDIDMIGPLTVYDIAHRLGAFLGLEPTRVYLHRGTRDGARVLGLGRGRHALDLAELPREFHRLTAAEAEDCLCIYKAQLRHLMETMKSKPSYTIDKSKLPQLFPTHRHDPAFWCSLGRAVATFGFLEEMLKKAVLALAGTYPAPADPSEREAALKEFNDLLARTLGDTLSPLIDTFGEKARLHPESRHQNLGEFVDELREAVRLRNLICHGSWAAPDQHGASKPFFVTKRGEVFGTPVTIAWLDQLQAHTSELATEVINTVTHMGYQFPGGSGPGRPVV